MTYGWAILIIAVVLGVLFQLGIFSSSSFTSTGCVSATGYLCQSPALSSNGLLTVQLGEVGSVITITGLGCSNTAAPPSFFSYANIQVSSGGISTAGFYCPLTTNAIGTSFSGTLWIQYGSGTQTGLTAQIGTINAKATSLGPPFIVYSAITRVQGPARGTSTTSSISVTMAYAPAAGDTLIAAISSIYAWQVSSITQTGVTWTMQNSGPVGWGGSPAIAIWAGTVGTGASNTATITFSGGSGSQTAIADISEYSGLASNPLDQHAASDSNSNAAFTGTTPTTTYPYELWIGAINYAYSTSPQSNPTGGFTLLDGAVFNNWGSLAYLEKIVSTTGAASCSTSAGASSYPWYFGAMATFEATNTLVP